MFKKLLIVIFCLSLLTGCYDYKEVGNLAICVGMAIDKGENYNYHLTVQILHPFSESSGEATAGIIAYESEGDTLRHAISNLYLDLPLELFTGHLQVIIFSKEVAQDGLHDLLEFLIRDKETSKNADLLVARQRAGDILQVLTNAYQVPAVKIKMMVEKGAKNENSIIDVKMDDFIARAERIGVEPYIPSLKLLDKDGKAVDSGSLDINTSDKTIRIILDAPAIFRNYQLHDFLTSEEGVGLSMLEGKNSNYFLPFTCDNSKTASLVATAFSAKMSGELSDGQLKYYHKFTISAALTEYPCSNNPATKEVIDSIIKGAKETVVSFASTALETFLYQYQLDVAGYQEYLYRHHYRTWQKIKDDFSDYLVNSTYQIDVKITLVKSGSVIGTI